MAEASKLPATKNTVYKSTGKTDGRAKWFSKSHPLTIKSVIYLLLELLANLG